MPDVFFQVIYHHEKPANALRLTKGKNELCVAETGEYVVKPKSCHVFTQKTYKFNTANPQPILLQAVAHVFSIKFLSNFKDPQLKLVVISSSKAKGKLAFLLSPTALKWVLYSSEPGCILTCVDTVYPFCQLAFHAKLINNSNNWGWIFWTKCNY